MCIGFKMSSLAVARPGQGGLRCNKTPRQVTTRNAADVQDRTTPSSGLSATFSACKGEKGLGECLGELSGKSFTALLE